MNSPAFKEWHVITEALGAGEQIIILRKGGISEGRSGFQIEANRFWLFPTHFHQQLEKTKPSAARFAPPQESTAPATIALRYFADIVHTAFLTDWPAIVRLDQHHFWTEATVRERFEWSRPAGIHALIVRVYKLSTPFTIPLTPAMGGCKSWIDLPCTFDAQPSAPALSDTDFARQRAALSL